MTLFDLQELQQKNPKAFKHLPWQTQVAFVIQVLDNGASIDNVCTALKVSTRWISNCIKVSLALQYRPEWHIKHARSLQQAVTTVNLRNAQEKRKKMEKKASEAPAISRTILG